MPVLDTGIHEIHHRDTEFTEMGRRTAEYTFSMVSVVNILDAPHGGGA